MEHWWWYIEDGLQTKRDQKQGARFRGYPDNPEKRIGMAGTRLHPKEYE